jgi:hypothetical protein
MMERYHFPPMLGPASRQVEGSYEWAECYGNELDHHVESLADEVDRFAGIIGKLVAADPPLWTTFPKPPCRTADAFFRLCGGMTQEQTAAVLAAYGHTNLADVVRDL